MAGNFKCINKLWKMIRGYNITMICDAYLSIYTRFTIVYYS